MGQLVEQRRLHHRRPIGQTVEFLLPDGSRRSGVCRDLSLSGAHIETTEPAPFGSSVTVFMELEDIDGSTALEAVVRWTKPDAMGVQFELFGAQVTHAILRVLIDRQSNL
jgi:hypothetical protein